MDLRIVLITIAGTPLRAISINTITEQSDNLLILPPLY